MDKEQFILIVKQYANLLYKVCHSYCANSNDHPDLEQEILMQLWLAIPRYDGRVKMSTWIYKIAINTAISFYRKERKRTDINEEVYLTLQTDNYNPEIDEQIEQLYRFIAQLNDLDKALMLLYLEDTKYSDIADVLGISESNVATKINRIKNKLKTQFKTSPYGHR